MTKFTVGQKVVLIQRHAGLEKGREVTISHVFTYGHVRLEETDDVTWHPDWFEELPSPHDVAIVADDASPVVRRPYDYKQGDARRFDFDDAIRLAESRVISRGCRQQVRKSTPALLGREPLWLIQDI